MTVVSTLTVNGDRLNCAIDRLAKIGQQPSGCISRFAFSPETLQARYHIQQWMHDVGMTTRVDAAGNLIGRYAGKNNHAPALATGSHIDTVPSGGRFDGVLGVLAGIEVIRTLHENHLHLNHPIEVIVFTDEENTMIGCQAMAGTVLLNEPERYRSKTGESIQTCLEFIGGNWDEIATAKRDRADLAAFVELHIEQGSILERSKTEIGIVQGVVGIRRKAITITGQANHAGTTPMDMRQDAMVAAAKVILAVQEIAQHMPSQPVATVGYLKASPNAVNIIAGQVELSVDLRDLYSDCLDEMLKRLEEATKEIAIDTNTTIEIHSLLCVEPSLSARSIQQTIQTVCQQFGLSCCSLPSRAGHDALELGRITDMGMIFVPSQAGVSHSEAEYTSPEQCLQGADVLLHTLMQLDKVYPI
jgi:beta-ureidopropionase / N-carbamoyl-L-amino-acid hydrolase